VKLSRIKIVLITFAVLLVGAAAVSQTVKRAHWHGRGHMLAFFTRYLNLSDAQQAQVKQIIAREKPSVQPLVLQLAQAHHQLRQMEEGGTFDEAQVRNVVAQQSQTISDLIVQKTRIETELMQVLNPEQKTKLKELLDRREQRFIQHLQEQPGTNQDSE
jgi:periplasmic protein CpxP/Spy